MNEWSEWVAEWVDSCMQTLGCAEVPDQHLHRRKRCSLLGSLFSWIVILNSEQGFPNPSRCHLKHVPSWKQSCCLAPQILYHFTDFENHY